MLLPKGGELDLIRRTWVFPRSVSFHFSLIFTRSVDVQLDDSCFLHTCEVAIAQRSLVFVIDSKGRYKAVHVLILLNAILKYSDVSAFVPWYQDPDHLDQSLWAEHHLSNALFAFHRRLLHYSQFICTTVQTRWSLILTSSRSTPYFPCSSSSISITAEENLHIISLSPRLVVRSRRPSNGPLSTPNLGLGTIRPSLSWRDIDHPTSTARS